MRHSLLSPKFRTHLILMRIRDPQWKKMVSNPDPDPGHENFCDFLIFVVKEKLSN